MRYGGEGVIICVGHYVWGGLSDTILLLSVVAAFMLIYTVLGGFLAVVVNDLFQLIFALLGALTVTYIVLDASGGMSTLLADLRNLNRPELLSIFPWHWTKDGLQWINGTGISITTFFSFVSLQWWSFRRSDGGGEFIQRRVAPKDEKETQKTG